jgi:hypothetical protein
MQTTGLKIFDAFKEDHYSYKKDDNGKIKLYQDKGPYCHQLHAKTKGELYALVKRRFVKMRADALDLNIDYDEMCRQLDEIFEKDLEENTQDYI